MAMINPYVTNQPQVPNGGQTALLALMQSAAQQQQLAEARRQGGRGYGGGYPIQSPPTQQSQNGSNTNLNNMKQAYDIYKNVSAKNPYLSNGSDGVTGALNNAGMANYGGDFSMGAGYGGFGGSGAGSALGSAGMTDYGAGTYSAGAGYGGLGASGTSGALNSAGMADYGGGLLSTGGAAGGETAAGSGAASGGGAGSGIYSFWPAAVALAAYKNESTARGENGARDPNQAHYWRDLIDGNVINQDARHRWGPDVQSIGGNGTLSKGWSNDVTGLGYLGSGDIRGWAGNLHNGAVPKAVSGLVKMFRF